MEKILPLTNPLSYHSPAISYLLSIIQTTSNYKAWLVNNLLNFCISKDYHARTDGFFRTSEFYNYPFFTFSSISYDLLDNWNMKFYKLIKFAIDNNCYIYGMLNRYPLKIYNGSKTAHNMLVYGYNTHKKEIYFCDFFPLRHGEGSKYKRGVCTPKEINQSIYNFEGVNYDRTEDTLVLLHLKKNINYKYSIEEMKKSILLFLNSDNIMKYQFGQYINLQYYSYDHLGKNEFYFGVSCYTQISKYILKDDFMKVRTLVLFRDFAIIWKERLEFINNEINLKNYLFLITQICDIINFSQNIILVFLKMRLSNNLIKRRIERIKLSDKIVQLQKQQISFLDTFLTSLNVQNS